MSTVNAEQNHNEVWFEVKNMEDTKCHKCGKHLIGLVIVLSFFIIFTVSSSAIDIDNRTIMQQIQAAFEIRNKNITDITFLQIIPFYGWEKRYLLLAHGIRADKQFGGSLGDELFGLFVLDKSFSQVLGVMDFITSGRWNDYSVIISNPDAATVLAICKGDTYGDGKIVKKYSTEPIYRNYSKNGGK